MSERRDTSFGPTPLRRRAVSIEAAAVAGIQQRAAVDGARPARDSVRAQRPSLEWASPPHG